MTSRHTFHVPTGWLDRVSQTYAVFTLFSVRLHVQSNSSRARPRGHSVLGSAFAAPCAGSSVGTAQTTDVTFAGLASDACVISGINPQQGPSGNTSGFDGDLWRRLGVARQGDEQHRQQQLDGVNFTWTFAQTTGRTGTWTLAADKDVTLDLVFAMHASNHSGAFLFDDQSVFARRRARGRSTG